MAAGGPAKLGGVRWERSEQGRIRWALLECGQDLGLNLLLVVGARSCVTCIPCNPAFIQIVLGTY